MYPQSQETGRLKISELRVESETQESSTRTMHSFRHTPFDSHLFLFHKFYSRSRGIVKNDPLLLAAAKLIFDRDRDVHSS